MNRFWLGVLMGAVAGGSVQWIVSIAWLSVIVGLIITCSVWCGEVIVEAAADIIDLFF